MNVKYRSVLAVGMSVAMMIQAPVIAFASQPTELSITNSSSGLTVNNPDNTSLSTSGTSVTINGNVIAETTNNDSSTKTALEVTANNSTSLDVTANNNTISSINHTTDGQGTITGTNYGTAVDVNGSANFSSSGSNIIGDVRNDGTGNVSINGNVRGDAINTSSGTVAITGSVVDIVTVNDGKGNVTNSGSGYIGIGGSVAGNVSATGAGDIGIAGSVVGNVSNGSGTGNVYILGGIGSSAQITATGTVSDSNNNDNIVTVTENATVIDGIIAETQIHTDDGSLFVYKVVDGSDEGTGITNASHYIIKSSGTTLYKATLEDQSTENTTIGSYAIGENTKYVNSTFQQLDRVINDMAGLYSSPQYWEYASAGNSIVFEVPSGYNYSSTITATSIGNGRYVLTVPAGGGVDIQVWRRVIENVISKETGAPAVIVENNTPEEVPAGISGVDGIEIISTAAGNALPTTELGNAVVATKSVSLNISKVTPAQFRDAVKDTVQTVPAGGVAVIETSEAATLDSNMIEAMAARPDVEYNIVFMFDGLKMRVVIPAGFDVKSLLDENGYCGFLRLAQLLGFTVLEK